MNELEYPERHNLTLGKNEKVAICRCWASKNFPYCDGSHRQLKQVGPIIIESAKPSEPQS
ncbi:CDGSH iron-sulfur domain-containing protein [Gammaproteobacteria bacterium]|nr:CDGSH iron-sulfur domain-containing protein [Gammaproteobacteria bacterium]